MTAAEPIVVESVHVQLVDCPAAEARNWYANSVPRSTAVFCCTYRLT
jgi:hypothetical protein